MYRRKFLLYRKSASRPKISMIIDYALKWNLSWSQFSPIWFGLLPHLDDTNSTYCLKDDKIWIIVWSTNSQHPVKFMEINKFWWWAIYSILARVTQWQSFKRNNWIYAQIRYFKFYFIKILQNFCQVNTQKRVTNILF